MSRLGIVCALNFEAACFAAGRPVAHRPVALGERTLLILSGMGAANARAAAAALSAANVDCLASFGVAGALAPGLEAGDLVQPQTLLEHGAPLGLDARLDAAARRRLDAAGIAFHDGPLCCADQVVASAAAKRTLFERTGAVAVDQETGGILAAARDQGLPALALRVIVDAADLALPEPVLRRIDEYGRVNALAAGRALLGAPGAIPAAVRLAAAAHRAVRTMRLVARELLRGGWEKR